MILLVILFLLNVYIYIHTTEPENLRIVKERYELLREHRLLKSLNLLKTERNIMQTSYDVGFTSPSYFTKCFQERFGMTPLSYVKEL